MFILVGFWSKVTNFSQNHHTLFNNVCLFGLFLLILQEERSQQGCKLWLVGKKRNDDTKLETDQRVP